MHANSKKLRWVAPAAVAALALAACSSSGSSGGSSAGSGSGAGSGGSSAGTPVHGGTMQVAFQSDPDTFDPQVCYDATCWDNMQMLFDRLYDYQTNTTNLEPEAAASMPQVSANGEVYTIAIRPGMTFDNGQPVTAQDFVVSYSPGQSIVLKRNPHYWNKALPYVTGVNEALGVTPTVQLLELEKGQINLMGDPLPNSSYLSVIGNKSLGSQVLHRDSLDTYFLTMNVHIKPFDNPLVREAVSYAIDRSFLLKTVNGQGSPATGFIPPGVIGYTSQDLVNPLDLAKAKALLAQAGYPHGFTTTLYSWNTQPWTNLDPAIQQQLGAIGINLKVQPIQESTFFSLAGTPGKAPMTLTFWVADYPDGSDFFQALVSCAADIPGGQNYAFYCNSKVDSEINKGLADPANAGTDYVQASKDMLADNPVVPLYFGTTTEVRGAGVGGFFANPIWDWEMDFYWLKPSGSGSGNGGGLGG